MAALSHGQIADNKARKPNNGKPPRKYILKVRKKVRPLSSNRKLKKMNKAEFTAVLKRQ